MGGPRDAQEWTLQQLGLRNYVGIVATTACGTTMVDGLLRGRVIRKHCLEARDGEQRQGHSPSPGQSRGGFAVHCDENEAEGEGQWTRSSIRGAGPTHQYSWYQRGIRVELQTVTYSTLNVQASVRANRFLAALHCGSGSTPEKTREESKTARSVFGPFSVFQ